MKELQNIINAYDRIKQTGKRAALATVVNIGGSTLRRPGARMLITEDGDSVGIVSGGCIETDIYRRSRDVIANGTPTIVTYDASSPDDLVLGFGLGCAGVVQILLERIPEPGNGSHLDFVAELIREGMIGVIATVCSTSGEIRTRTGDRLLMAGTQTKQCQVEEPGLAELIRRDSAHALDVGRSAFVHYELTNGTVDTFIEIIHPPIPLIIFGAGASSVPLVRLAKELGWRVTVVDNRTAFLKKERFPEADILLLSHADEIARTLHLTERDVTLLMTHNYASDVTYLRFLLPSPVRYIGLLGPKKKGAMMVEDLRRAGFAPTEAQLSRLFNPVGIDLGAETAEELGLAIIAEIQAVLTQRPAGFLRDRILPIHT
jgi:xanthine/CO dehydrogenase XdhC/CoxF family maturation factor